MKKFDHIKAASYEEAAQIIRDGQGKVDAIAAGTDVLGTYKDRILPEYPDAVVSLKSIPDSDYIREEEDYIAIGAGATLKKICEDPMIQEKAQALAEAAHSVASPIIRSTATIGGNVCQDVRCWYYRYPDNIGGCLNCRRKGGDTCYAIAGENRYHSIFGGMSTGSGSSCQLACPAGTDIPAYMERIRANDFDGAAKIFFRYNPMPMMTSRICQHVCMDSCNQKVYGEAVNIPAVERALGDYILAHKEIYYAAPAHSTGKKAAVIGAGPGGLTTAFYLRQAGNEVTVYDAHEKPGGVLQYGIPHYRLPKSIVDEFCGALKDIMGIKFVMNTKVGTDITVEEIKAQHDCVYFGTGAWRQPVLGLDGENLTSFGLNFLEEVNTYLQKTIGEEVLVCGGGNVAMDVALTSRRLGAKKVKLICLEQRWEMPADESEIKMAEEEGVEICNGWGLGKVLSEDGKVTGLMAKKCLSVRDENGRFHPVYDENETMEVKSDFIILATGQGVDVSFLPENLSAQLKTERGLINADIESGKTREAGYYAGGDAVTGPNLAIRAIRAGRSAARSMIRDFGQDACAGQAAAEAASASAEAASASAEGIPAADKYTHFDVKGVEETKQHKQAELPVDQRTLAGEDFSTLAVEEAIAEAKRCLHCACYAVNASDITPVLVMLGASLVTTEREISAKELFTSKLTVQKVLNQGELVKEIRVPKAAGLMHYDKRRVRDAIDFAIVSLASRFVVEDGIIRQAAMVCGGVAPVPYELPEVTSYLTGKKITKELAREAGEIAMKQATPMRENAYKVFMAKDVIYEAICRAGGFEKQEIPVL
ncbi:MAG: FAD binding domain-containing protein [Lachnospiraceae bacterium]|nr:FAD binding domain-containing protein [Lachnospiraceae bacterium]